MLLSMLSTGRLCMTWNGTRAGPRAYGLGTWNLGFGVGYSGMRILGSQSFNFGRMIGARELNGNTTKNMPPLRVHQPAGNLPNSVAHGAKPCCAAAPFLSFLLHLQISHYHKSLECTLKGSGLGFRV